jgi:hypothetical protein
MPILDLKYPRPLDSSLRIAMVPIKTGLAILKATEIGARELTTTMMVKIGLTDSFLFPKKTLSVEMVVDHACGIRRESLLLQQEGGQDRLSSYWSVT